MNPTQPLNDNELEELDDFLMSEEMPENAMDVSMLDGFFASLVLHPQIIMPSEYLRWIWDAEKGEDEPAFPSLDRANRILNLIMRHYNSVLQAIGDDSFEPLFFALVQEDGSEFFDAEGWCEGFMLGVSVFNEPWDAVFEDRPELVVPMVLLGTEGGWEILEKSGDEKHAIQEAYESIADAVSLLYEYFREQREAATQERLARPGRNPSGLLTEVVQTPGARFKVGRNEPCPCGSGKKFKKCCGAPPTLH